MGKTKEKKKILNIFNQINIRQIKGMCFVFFYLSIVWSSCEHVKNIVSLFLGLHLFNFLLSSCLVCVYTNSAGFVMLVHPPTSFEAQFCSWWLWYHLLGAPRIFDVFRWHHLQSLLWYHLGWTQYILRLPQINSS